MCVCVRVHVHECMCVCVCVHASVDVTAHGWRGGHDATDTHLWERQPPNGALPPHTMVRAFCSQALGPVQHISQGPATRQLLWVWHVRGIGDG